MRCLQLVTSGFILAGLAGGLYSAPQDPTTDDGLVRRGPKSLPDIGSAPLMTFNLVALDAKGEPVRNLRASDLDIRNDGKLMQAVFCRPLASAALTAPLAPNEYTNRPSSDQSQTTVVVLDLLNQNTVESGFEAKDLARTLGKLEGIERLYLYLLSQKGELYPVHAITRDKRKAVEDAWTAHAPQLLQDAMRTVSNDRNVERSIDPDKRVRDTLGALQALATGLAMQAGPKSLVWITHGAGYGDRYRKDLSVPVVRLGSDLARAGITIYGVDQAVDHPDDLWLGTHTFDQLASATGGLWLSANNIDAAIRQVLTEGRSLYRVAYRPPLGNWDDELHKLRVSSSNSRVRVRTLDSYFADKSVRDPDGRFRAAAGGVGDRGEIGIRTVVEASQKGKNWVRLKTQVDAADLDITGDTNLTGEMRVTVTYYVYGWRPDRSQEVAFPVALSKEQYAVVLRQGITLLLDRPLPAGVSKLRVVVLDVKSGAVGTLTLPVESAATQ